MSCACRRRRAQGSSWCGVAARITTPRKRQRRAALAAAALVATGSSAAAGEILVFAASSLAPALDHVAEAWEAETGHTVVISYAGSSVLARQIQEGAPADLFFSASTTWMDDVEATGDIREGTRRDILGNALVLVAHGRGAEAVMVDENLDLASMLGSERLAMGLVDAVPVGIYGKEALISLGLWERVAPLVAQSDNAHSALALVAQNEAPLGIVYATDAAAEQNVSVIGTFPETSHAPIIYPAALTAGRDSEEAAGLLDFLSSSIARSIWKDFGFVVLE